VLIKRKLNTEDRTRKQNISLSYTSETQIKQQRLPCLCFVWIKIETSVIYGLEISFQKTNDFGIFVNLPERNKSRIPQIFSSLTALHVVSFAATTTNYVKREAAYV
jgi:hypothetical protein